MIVVRIELWSAITGKVSEIGRMYIGNNGQHLDPSRGDYDVKVARRGSRKPAGWRDFEGFDRIRATRTGHVQDYPRLSYNVWRLVSRALHSAFPEER